MSTSLLDYQDERTSDTPRSQNSPKTVVRVPYPPEKNLDIFTKVFHLTINKKGETETGNY